MFNVSWKTSERKYKVVVERNVRVKMSDGVRLDADVFRPNDRAKFPAIISAHPYSKEGQTEPVKVSSMTPATRPHPFEERSRGSLESGDPYFYARRGYAHIIANVRGSGSSEGFFEFLGPREATDIYELIEWTAAQPWCDGNVGMFGVSYFAMIQLRVAGLNPPHLKCIFAPWGTTDIYRDMIYNGGLLSARWLIGWTKTSFVYGNVRPKSQTLTEIGEERLNERSNELLKDPDISNYPEFVDALTRPTHLHNPLIVDVLLNSLDDQYWEERRAKYEGIKVPAYIGADWSMFRMHLPAAFRSWENIRTPKRMIIGPPSYLDRPLYQLQYESLRWFDHWLKNIENGIMDEPPVKLFVMETGKWKDARDWPLPETKWTPFYVHENGLLCERDYWSQEGSDSFFDSPYGRGFLEYLSPPLVEETEVIGPIVANLYASTTGDEILWSLRLFEVANDEKRRILTGGWLRGTHRKIDPTRSKPWLPFHPHNRIEVLEREVPYEFNIAIVPTGKLFKPGSRIGLRISCADYDSTDPNINLEGYAHIKHQYPSRITLYHNDDYPSHLLLPITSGNVLGTFISGKQLV